MCGCVRMCMCVRDEQRHQALEPPRPPPTTKKRHISLFAPYIMRKPRRGRGVRLYLLSPLYPLSYVSRMCLCCLSLTVNECVIRTQRDQSASQERTSTVVALVSGAMPLTHRRQTATVSRYTVAFKVLEDSVSGGGGDSSGFRGSAFTAPPGGGGGRCRPHPMSDARF